jgi:hypothetical protein
MTADPLDALGSSPPHSTVPVYQGDVIQGYFEPSRAEVVAESRLSGPDDGDAAWETLYRVPAGYLICGRFFTDLDGRLTEGPARLVTAEEARRWLRDTGEAPAPGFLAGFGLADLTPVPGSRGKAEWPGRRVRTRTAEREDDGPEPGLTPHAPRAPELAFLGVLSAADRPLTVRTITRRTGRYEYDCLRKFVAGLRRRHLIARADAGPGSYTITEAGRAAVASHLPCDKPV